MTVKPLNASGRAAGSAFPVAAAFFAAALILAAPFASARADDHDDRSRRTISVSGSGEVSMRPDTANITAGVLTEGEDAKAALRANSETVAKIFAALKDAGIEGRDMQTSNFGISPRYDRPDRNQPPRLTGYRVSNQVSVRVRDLESLGVLLDALAVAGANQMNGIRFYVEDSTQQTDEARRRAVADARRKAELYAVAAGAELGGVLSISESGGRPPQPVFRAMAVAEDAKSVPVAPGEQTISASVSITYRLK